MIGEFSNIKIQGMASAVPSLVEENQSFENILGVRRVKKQIKLTGVSKRHVSKRRQRTSDLCYAAATKLIDQLKWNADDIKVLIFITQGPNYVLPSTAFFLQKRLGIGKDCVAFDINLGCSSFNVGVHVVSALMQNCNLSDKALLLIGDTAGVVMKPGDKIDAEAIANRLLFGAAGAAIAIEKVDESPLYFMNKSDGNGYDAIIRHPKGQTHMNGEAVFQFAINDVSEDVIDFKKKCNLKEEDIDYYVFHQAQKLILDNIAAICEIPEERELRSLEEYGNTSGTSVPVSICSNLDKIKDKESVKLLLCGFGVGLSWGIIYADIPTENILPVIVTDEHFDEDKVPQEKLSDKKVLVWGADTAMGQTLCRCLSQDAAQIYMEGKDTSILEFVREDLFYKNDIMVNDEQTIDYCKENNIQFAGVVVANNDDISELLKKMADEEILATNASVVKLSTLETYNKDETTLYADSKNQIEDMMKKEMDFLGNIQGRVNVVAYNDEAVNIVQTVGPARDWIEKYISESCPDNMLRPLRIADAVSFLLSDQAQYISKTIISVNQ